MGEREAQGPEYPAMSKKERGEQNLLWLGLLGGPLGVLLNLQMSYMLVDWVCLNGHHYLLHVVPVVFIVTTLLAGFAAYRSKIRIASTTDERRPRSTERSRFMASLGMMLSAISLLAIAAQWTATFFIDPCKP